MNLGAMSVANQEIEAAINYARLHGKDKNGQPYFFFDLVLDDAGVLAGDPEHFSISGFDELNPREPRSDKNGNIVYDFDENKGGYTKFTKQADGSYLFTMWDTDHNRNFVATHWDSGFWTIKDPLIEDQIYEIYLKIQEDLKKKKESPTQAKLIDLQQKYKTVKPEEKQEVMAQMQGLIKDLEEIEMPAPKKGLANKAKREKYRFPPTAEQLDKIQKRPARKSPVKKEVESSPLVKIDE